MHIYRFKVRFEDQDEFSREFELLADQTFEDFYLILTGNLNLDPMTLSSFFICDQKFRKKKEIFLEDMNPESDDEGASQIVLMRSSRLNAFIDDPHQKLLLVFDYLSYWTFYIELVKIIPADPARSYPRLARSEGEVPRELVPKTDEDLQSEVDESSDEVFFEDELYDPDDLDALEGKEDFLGEAEQNQESFDDEKPF